MTLEKKVELIKHAQKNPAKNFFEVCIYLRFKASDVVKAINILIGLKWTALAWSQGKPQIIIKCFRKAGILNADCDICSELVGDDNPFSDVDMHTAVQSLIEQTMPADEHCKYIDDGLPVCIEANSEQCKAQ